MSSQYQALLAAIAARCATKNPKAAKRMKARLLRKDLILRIRMLDNTDGVLILKDCHTLIWKVL